MIITDIKRAKQFATYPWFANKKPWQKEFKMMLDDGFKMEVEAMISSQYVPMKLKDKKQWLD